jgi:hypothetical protein
MVWLIFKLELWRRRRSIEQCHNWHEAMFRDRFDREYCRDCDVPEGMDW